MDGFGEALRLNAIRSSLIVGCFWGGKESAGIAADGRPAGKPIAPGVDRPWPQEEGQQLGSSECRAPRNQFREIVRFVRPNRLLGEK